MPIFVISQQSVDKAPKHKMVKKFLRKAITDSQNKLQKARNFECVFGYRMMMMFIGWFMQALCYIPDMPMFPNLVKFAIGNVLWGWSMLPRLLENMPNLEHITFLHVSLFVPRTFFMNITLHILILLALVVFGYAF